MPAKLMPTSLASLAYGLAVCGLGLAASADDGAGAAQFVKSCGTCHATAQDAGPRQGPNLWDVVGRQAGTLTGFKYSPGFMAGAAGIQWDAASIDRWITDPKAMIPGTIMMYKQADPEKRKLIIEYLQTLR